MFVGIASAGLIDMYKKFKSTVSFMFKYVADMFKN